MQFDTTVSGRQLGLGFHHFPTQKDPRRSLPLSSKVAEKDIVYCSMIWVQQPLMCRRGDLVRSDMSR